DKEIHDSWLESVDWESVKRKAAPTAASSSAAKKDASSDKDNEDSDPDGGGRRADSDSGSDELGLSQLADLPARDRGRRHQAARRRRQSALSASQRLRLKKAGGAAGTSKEEAAAAARQSRERMLALCELAGRLRVRGSHDRLPDGRCAACQAGRGSATLRRAGYDRRPDKDRETKTPRWPRRGGVFWYYRVSDDPNAELMGRSARSADAGVGGVGHGLAGRPPDSLCSETGRRSGRAVLLRSGPSPVTLPLPTAAPIPRCRPPAAMSHSILLIQPDLRRLDGRVWADYNSIEACLDGVCRVFEEHLKASNPQAPTITYDIAQLFDFIESLGDLSCLVLNRPSGTYVPHNKDWIKERLYVLLRKQSDGIAESQVLECTELGVFMTSQPR
uniref:Enhancer of rudimentary homolog n=1 Tax=Macrostomum lignano TaxID=282301 RepID=A0A1I8JNI8_9PLAT